MDWRRWGRVALAVAIAALGWTDAGFAQTALTGGVNGRVKHATGAALPGVNVSIAPGRVRRSSSVGASL